MLAKFKKNEISISLFVTVSILCLFLLVLFFVLFRFYWPDSNGIKLKKITNQVKQTEIGFNDPLITKGPSFTNKITSPVLNGQDPTLGKNESPITIVLYGDFACQACKNQEKTIKDLRNLYPDKIAVVWKDYPDQNQDSLSYRAALAGRCADEQNNFWPYHDLLFEQANSLDVSDLFLLAKKTNLNTEQFSSCLNKRKTASKINANIKEANDLGLPGVPFVYLNKQEFLGQTTFQELLVALENELKLEN